MHEMTSCVDINSCVDVLWMHLWVHLVLLLCVDRFCSFCMPFAALLTVLHGFQTDAFSLSLSLSLSPLPLGESKHRLHSGEKHISHRLSRNITSPRHRQIESFFLVCITAQPASFEPRFEIHAA